MGAVARSPDCSKLKGCFYTHPEAFGLLPVPPGCCKPRAISHGGTAEGAEHRARHQEIICCRIHPHCTFFFFKSYNHHVTALEPYPIPPSCQIVAEFNKACMQQGNTLLIGFL